MAGIALDLRNAAFAMAWPIGQVLPRIGDISGNMSALRESLLQRVRGMGRKFSKPEAGYIPQAVPTPIGPLPYGLGFVYQCQSCALFQPEQNRCEAVGGWAGEEDGYIGSSAWCAIWMPDPAKPENRRILQWVRSEAGDAARIFSRSA